MLLGHPNFSSWLNAQLLARYGRKRFKIQQPIQRQQYVSAHHNPDTNQWLKPLDLKRVSFTNLSLYNTEYSVFKYLLETELDVLQKAPYSQLTVYTEIIDHSSPDTFIKPIDGNTFLVGIHFGRIQQISNLFLTTEVVPNILQPFTHISKINQRFLKSFAMELAVKATIYKEFANIFTPHSALKNTLNDLINREAIPEKYHCDCLVGAYLTKEIQTRTRSLVESNFFEEMNDAETLTKEVLQLCIASLYVYYAQQSQQTEPLSAAERIFCTFNSLTKTSQNNRALMLKTINQTHSIIESQDIKLTSEDLYTQHRLFNDEMLTQ